MRCHVALNRRVNSGLRRKEKAAAGQLKKEAHPEKQNSDSGASPGGQLPEPDVVEEAVALGA